MKVKFHQISQTEVTLKETEECPKESTLLIISKPKTIKIGASKPQLLLEDK